MSRLTLRKTLTLVAVAAVALWGAHVAQAVSYEVIDLGTLGGPTSQANAINNAGQVVGKADLASGASHAFVWENAPMLDLGTLGGANSSAYAINDNGEIVGSSYLAGDTTYHAFRTLVPPSGLEAGGPSLTDLGTLGGTNSSGSAIGNVGIPGGTAQIVGGARHAAYHTEGFQDMGTFGGPQSFLNGANNWGLFVGQADIVEGPDGNGEDGLYHAFVWDY